MDFDFQTFYAALSGKELEKIIANPGKYPAEAIAAATAILAARKKEQETDNISEDEYEPDTGDYERYKTDLFYDEPAADKSSDQWVRRWIVVILYLVTFRVLVSLYVILRFITTVLKTVTATALVNRYLLFDFGHILFWIFAMILLVKRKQAGWHLMIAGCCYTLILSMYSIVSRIAAGIAPVNLVIAAIYAVICGALLTWRMRSAFRIEDMHIAINLLLTAAATIIYLFF